ncbi:MAG: phytoene desaturase family protein [Planctomycetota bacterium]
MSCQRVAVVGAGPGGLSCAVLLAASGLDVTIFESQPIIGGRTARISLTGDNGRDYHFDRGPTFFLMPYVLEEIFAAAGKNLHEHATLSQLDPMYRLLLGRENASPITLDCTQDIAEMTRRLAAIDPADASNFARFIDDNRTKLNLMEPILRKPIRSLLDLADFETAKVVPHLNPHLSVHQLLSKYFKNPLVQRAVSFQSKYLGMSPHDCPSIFTILPFIEYEYGIWHPTGGCNALMAAMAEVFTEIGGTIKTASPVERVMFSGKTATGVVIDGDEQRFDHVVINADAPWAIKNLIPSSVRGGQISDTAIDRKKYSCSTAMLYLGLEGEVDLPHHTIYVTGKYEDNLADITDRGRMTEDPSIYVCNPSALDPGLSPEGDSALYVLLPTPNCKVGESGEGGGIDWSTEAGPTRTRMIEQMERVFGIDDIERRTRAELMLTPDDWRASNIQFGATFNMAHGLMQMLHRRPHNELNGLRNCWLVGGGTHPGSGLPVIFLSSQTTARLVCDRAGVSCAIDRPLKPAAELTAV